MKRGLARVALAALFLAAFALPSSAQTQVYTGRIDVTVVDSTGAVLPGVTVNISGMQSAMKVTDPQGEAHFLALPPGTYTVKATLKGFSPYNNANVPVNTGESVPLRVTMAVAGVASSVEVQAATPVMDTKSDTEQTNFDLNALQKIPSSRDPWVVLQSVPGVIVDRVNVGSGASGQQSDYLAKGAAADQGTWSMDGIPITDMAALGSSPTYFDFDQFQQINVTTGGADVTQATPGAALNFVLRSGTNMWRGSGRYYFENHDLASDNFPTSLFGQLNSYPRTNTYKDYGFEAGGPIVQNKVFVWGAYGRTQPWDETYTYQSTSNTYLNQNNDCTGSGTYTTTPGTYAISARDCTLLENYAAKGTAQLTQDLRATFTYFRGNKVKNGRGASADRTGPTTWNQTGPTSLYKGEVNYTLSDNTFLTARFGYIAGGFSLTPQGGLNTQLFIDDNGVDHGSYLYYATNRPQWDASAEGDTFKGKNELKYGFGWRRTDVTSTSLFPGGVYAISVGYPNYLAVFYRDYDTAESARYVNAYAQDTISLNRLTINAGVRFDRGTSSLVADTSPANPSLPVLMPALSVSPINNVFAKSIITPRVGITYALNDSRKSIVRASYSIFADQLNATQANVLSTIQYSAIYFYGTDLNHDMQVQPNEIQGNLQTGAGNVGYYGFDPSNPGATSTVNTVGNYSVPKTQEVLLGFDQQVGRDLALSATYTYRRYTDLNWEHYVGVDGTSYTLAGSYSCNATEQTVVGPCTVPYYTTSAIPSNSAQVFETRPGYHQRYQGFDLSATKRMSNHWMARLAFSTNDDREYWDSLASIQNPTSTPGSPNVNGGEVVVHPTNSGRSSDYLIYPKYQFIAQGNYEAPYGIVLGVNYLLRQGYAAPYNHSQVVGSGYQLAAQGQDLLLTGTVDAFRLPAVNSLDFRIGKEVKLRKTDINFDVDVFNLLNLNTTTVLDYDLRHTTGNDVQEILNPRIVRLGVRIGFN